jgi:hypothetical protein
MRRAGGFGCGCEAQRVYTPMGGIFTDILNVAGSFVGDPGAGNQIASQSPAAFGPITQTPAQIATTVLPGVQSALAAPSTINTKNITAASQQIATTILPQTAQAAAAAGYSFPPGSVGASLTGTAAVQGLDAFGGQNAEWVLLGGLALGALLIFKVL